MIPDLHVCLYPMPLAWGDKPRNLDTLREAVAMVPKDTDLLVLPEMFSTGFLTSDKEQIRELAERNTGETVALCQQLAQQYGMAVAGSFIADTGGSLYNRAFFIEPLGEPVFADKRHLFTMGGEDKIFSQGDTRLSIRYRGWNIAMVVCYDIRFPVWCRNVGNEYDLMLAVANWPTSRVEAWQHLLRARAMENLAYVCGVDCSGTDLNGYEYDGTSLAYDFKGKDITVSNPASPFKFASLSYDKLVNFRQKFAAWKDADSFSIHID